MKLFLSYFAAPIAAALFVLFVVGVRHASAADSGACYSIGNGDARAYCLAKANRDPAMCYNIQDGSMRSMCLAEVRK